MQLVVENIARVSSAKLDLGGIAVLAGANGTGKSTISRSLMTLSSVSRRINSLITSERARSVVTALRKSFKEMGADIYYPEESFKHGVSLWGHWLSVDWWNSPSGVVAWLKEHNRQDVMVFPIKFLETDKCVDAINSAKPRILEALERPDDAYVTYVCRKLFRQAFNGQAKPVFANRVESVISVEDERKPDLKVSVSMLDGDVNAYSEIGRTFYPSVVYFEPLNYVDFVNSLEKPVTDRYSAGGLCSCEVIKRVPPTNLSLEEQSELDEANEIIKEIISSIHGRLVDDNSDIKFRENFSDGDHLIEVKNIASGMKTMAAIVRAVENRSIRRGSLLIIDEPESNLHPQWQVSFAAFLVAIAKRLNISLVLNTHSPYFLQAILVNSKQSVVPCRFYNMNRDANADSYHTEDVTDRLDLVFKTMAEPLDSLFAS